jgi:hypothetical protein
VAQELALAFRTTPEKMKALLAKLPLALKENVDHATALKYQKIVTDAGGVSRVEAVAAGGAAEKTGQASPPLKVCPKCGYKAVSSNNPLVSAFQGRGECPACGIILARFEQNVTRKDSGGRPVSEKASPRPIAGATAAKPALPIKRIPPGGRQDPRGIIGSTRDGRAWWPYSRAAISSRGSIRAGRT